MNDNNYDNDTNMILSSKLLQEMIGRLKEGIDRTESLVQSASELTIKISNRQKDSHQTIAALKQEVHDVEIRLISIIKEQSSSTNKEIILNNDQHTFMIKTIEDIDHRAANFLTDKIRTVMAEIGENSEDHKKITAVIGNIDERTIKLIETKNSEILKEFQQYSKKLEDITDTLHTILEKLGIFNNNYFKIAFMISIIGVLLGLFGGFPAIINFLKK